MTASYMLRGRARRDLDGIADHLAETSRNLSRRFYTAARKAMEKLASMPGLGGVLELPGMEKATELRVWPIPDFPNHLILYLPCSEGVEIVRVLHGAQDLLNLLQNDL